MAEKIIPKTAYIEIDCPIDDFYDEWEDWGGEIDPTQNDYDIWALATAMGVLECRRHELDNLLFLKTVKKFRPSIKEEEEIVEKVLDILSCEKPPSTIEEICEKLSEDFLIYKHEVTRVLWKLCDNGKLIFASGKFNLS